MEEEEQEEEDEKEGGLINCQPDCLPACLLACSSSFSCRQPDSHPVSPSPPSPPRQPSSQSDRQPASQQGFSIETGWFEGVWRSQGGGYLRICCYL